VKQVRGAKQGSRKDVETQRFRKAAPSGSQKFGWVQPGFASHTVFPIISANAKRDRRVKSC